MEAMARRYLAFDIETAKILPADVDDLMAHEPLGIACAAALAGDRDAALTWYARLDSGAPAPRMSRSEAQALVRQLSSFVAEGGVGVPISPGDARRASASSMRSASERLTSSDTTSARRSAGGSPRPSRSG
jgi:hypothetical protein